MKNEKEKISYCIGRPWYPDDINSSICVYSYRESVFYGSEKDANNIKKFIEGIEKPKKYNVYKLVKLG